MDTRKLLAEKREDILRMAARHGAFNVRLFGSVARGEAWPDSDIDLLVEVGPRHSSFFPGGLAADLEELLGRHVDIVEPEGLHWYMVHDYLGISLARIWEIDEYDLPDLRQKVEALIQELEACSSDSERKRVRMVHDPIT